MSLALVWSENAELTFDAIVIFIETTWGENSARKFVKPVNQLLLNLSNNPYVFKSTTLESNIRIAFITPQCSLVYKIHTNYIYLLYFWDNRQQPIT